MIEAGVIYPTSVSAWSECPYRYVYERCNKGEDTEATARGKGIHKAIREAFGADEGVSFELSRDMLNPVVTTHTMENGMVKRCQSYPHEYWMTFEEHAVREFERGVILAGYMDVVINIYYRNLSATEIIDIKTMKKLRADKVTGYRDSLQFVWYAFLKDAYRVICMPIVSDPLFETDGKAAWDSGAKYIIANRGDCVRTLEPVTALRADYGDTILQYTDWIHSDKMPRRTPFKFCHWCGAYLSGVCKGADK